MEAFDGVVFVRLRSYVRRSQYLAADVDGINVCLTSQRGTYNTVWAVHRGASPDGDACVLLRSAYGRYLFTTGEPARLGPSHGFFAIQNNLVYNPTRPGFLWQPLRRRSSIVLRNVTGRFLRANGRYCRWLRLATVALDNGSNMMRWIVEKVPVAMTRPDSIDPIRQLVHRSHPLPTEGEMSREIGYIRAADNGNIEDTPAAWRTTQLHTNSLMQLRVVLDTLLGPRGDVTHATICNRAGRYAQLTPLLIDLPINNDRMDIVILKPGTQADNDLRYPDLDAPVERRT
ncbi:hypothetical protein ACP70R_031679 [Stipagrostis hirtigluma subsp. patula]